jgi:Outer membrane protein beta-barrel domain
MNKDLHDIDDLFRSELEGYEETPSAALKERLIAALDKKDAESYKKRFIGWKRMALLLLLLLSGILLYESGILKTGSTGSGKRTAGDKQVNSLPENRQEPVYQNNTVADNTSNNNKVTLNDKPDINGYTVTADEKTVSQPEQKDNAVSAITKTDDEVGSVKNSLANKFTIRKSSLFYKQTNPLASTLKKDRAITPPYVLESKLPNITEDLQTGRINSFQSLTIVDFQKIIAQSEPGIKQFKFPAAIDSLTKNTSAKNKKIAAFTPFWMITSFASYERAGYRLDSDLPNNITSIKHREIHEPSFSIGLLATRQLTRHWGLQSGLIYSQTDIGISPQKLHALQEPGGNIAFKYVTSSGYAYIKPGFGAPPAIGDSLITKQGKHSLKFVSIPLAIKYSVGKNKFTFSPGAGIEANFLTSARVETELESPSNPEIVVLNKLEGTKPFHLAIIADAELRYKLNNKLSLNFRPAIRLAISPITKNNVVETFPRSVGFGVGLTYKF